MNTKVVKYVIAGFIVYIGLAISVMSLFPDSPDNMDWEDREAYNKVKIGTLELGASRDSVMQLLSAPDITEAKISSGDKLQVMFYRTQHKTADGITTMDECTPLLFKNDVLIAWGDDAYQTYQDS
ncbi:DUF3192 domain-containing protein [Aestuariibacter salexigens]|uniref:DUF3192 domain-containing protein n=1 Tax=Aestuariibacter salexigens TaxID=226010 RepID=UPI00041CDE12|nr:DUF3192 domain-containing protein [Aestuariibacter salexigens]